MIQIKDKKNCCGCGSCVQACPVGCITMRADEEGFLYPEISEEKCLRCGLCQKVCPILRSKESCEMLPKAFAAYALDETVRAESSSGGLFTLLAEQVLEKGGVIFGAALTQNLAVQHICVSDKNGLAKLRGSKYVQSEIKDTYILAREALIAGQLVLFSGTPCQIEGLYAFLQKEYENLACVDLICHGTPSPMVWNKYIEYQENMANSKLAKVDMRDKTGGWKRYSLKFTFGNGSVCKTAVDENLYMRVFLQDVCLRPACYRCKFKKVNRRSDITLADFWGIERVCPEMDDDRGTSLVIAHSKKGTEMLQAVSSKMRCKEVDLEQAIEGNAAIRFSAKLPKNRSVFMRKIQTDRFDKTVHKYAVRKRSPKSALKRILVATNLWPWAENVKRKIENTK